MPIDKTKISEVLIDWDNYKLLTFEEWGMLWKLLRHKAKNKGADCKVIIKDGSFYCDTCKIDLEK